MGSQAYGALNQIERIPYTFRDPKKSKNVLVTKYASRLPRIQKRPLRPGCPQSLGK